MSHYRSILHKPIFSFRPINWCICVFVCAGACTWAKFMLWFFWHTLLTDSHWLMSAKANKVRQINRFSYMSHSTIQCHCSLSSSLSLSNCSVVGSEFCSVAVPALPAGHKGFTDLLLTLGASSSKLIKHCTHLHFRITPSNPSPQHMAFNAAETCAQNIMYAHYKT